MTLLSHCQQALVNLAAAKLRSFLALLGILVGTAAVVALLTSGQLATEKALAQFKSLGTDLLAVSVFANDEATISRGEKGIPLAAWRRIPSVIPTVLAVAPYALAYQPMSFNGHLIQGPIVGVDETLANIIGIHLAQGHFVSFVNSFEHFCVIGEGIAEQLRQISFDSPLGKPLRIGKTLYTIVGVAKPWKENGFFNEDVNRSVMIPLAGMALVNKDSQISNAVMLLKPDCDIDEVIDSLKYYLHALAPSLRFFPRSAKQIIASMENQGHIFTLLLAVIGGISLLVGGIGVMNVMLVAVSERKKEIGIRKAVGARPKEIQALFLMESVLLSLFGGALGVLLGFVLSWLIAYFSHWSFAFYSLPPLAGFAVSVITGVFFGFYPAHRAAKVSAIASLRQE